MPSDQHCITCVCWKAIEDQEQTGRSSSLGVCRRRAPTRTGTITAFPTVRKDNWCAEYLRATDYESGSIGERTGRV